MTIDYLRNAVVEDLNDFYFDYNGRSCGVEIHHTTDKFLIYYGDDYDKIVSGGFDAVIKEPLFDGKSILDIFNTISDSIRFA